MSSAARSSSAGQSSKLGNNTSKSSGAKTMEELMKSAKQTSFVALQKGGVVQGVVTKITQAEILVDVNAKSEALAIEKDRKAMRYLLSIIKVGDKVDATVVSPESEFGTPIVSLRKYAQDLAWEKLLELKKQRKSIDVLVTELTKGGYTADVVESGLYGFLPHSYVTSLKNEQDVIGKRIPVFMVDINKAAHKIIFSQKPVLDTLEFGKLTEGIKVGQKVDSIISHITPFGAFVVLQNSKGEPIDGLIHISELSWDKTTNVEEQVRVGQHIEVVVIGVDKEAKRVDLSIKRLTEDPFESVSKNFSIDQKVSGRIKEIQSSGVLLDLGEDVEGFIRKEKVPPTVTYKVGQEIQASVSQIDRKRHRIILAPVLLEKPIGYR